MGIYMCYCKLNAFWSANKIYEYIEKKEFQRDTLCE